MKNKKGQLFTILAMVLIGLLFLSFELFSFINQEDSIKTRVSTMDSFLSSLEKNLERQMYISGYRIIFLAEDEITSTGTYIDVNDFFEEAFFNGTVNGENTTIMLGATRDDILTSINRKANKINVEITMNNISIEVSQIDPWHVKFSLISDFIMQDREDLARWDRHQEISGYIPIEEFEDPLFTVNTYARVSRKITKTPYGENYTLADLQAHISGKYYDSNPNAPSFLDRLEGNLSSNENGIESFVYIPELSAQSLPTLSKSCVDYIYFSNDNPDSTAMPQVFSWFIIDENHEDKYT